MRNIFFWNICFISCIINNNSSYFISIVNPLLKLVFCYCWTCWVVREAKIYNIRSFLWKLWCKISFCCTWHINYITPSLLFWNIIASSSCHRISINIYRIYRVTYCNLIIYRENISNITRVRLSTITYKNLIGFNISSTFLIIMLYDSIS